jgi:glycosyltransferase involved in cell wall biosynthesis
MPELLIDTTRLVGRLMAGRSPTGIDRVCLAYVRRYAPVARLVLRKGGIGVVLPRAPSRCLSSLLLERADTLSACVANVVAGSDRTDWPRSGHSGRVLLNLGHSGPERPQYGEWLRRRKLRPIFMVHDLIPVTHPEYCRPTEQARHVRRIQTILATAAGVVTNSQSTLQALCAYAADKGLPMPPALTAPLASVTFSQGAGCRPLESPYFVMLSTIEPRKNHWLMLHVWRRLVERLGEKAPRLVVIGQRGWECENVLDLLERCEVLRGFVIEKGGCSDADLATYLCHAQAMLFPSFVEGYGLPLIEALSLGVPVIASDLPVFHEVVGDIPEYLDPIDGTGWMNCVESFCNPASGLRAAQLVRMTKFTPPTWSAHFELFERLMEQVS